MTFTRRTFISTGAAALTLATLPRFALAEELTAEAVLFDPDGPVLGNPNGDVTIAEFFDYQCPFCKRNHDMLLDLTAQDGNIRLVMKDWPIFGAPSVRASQLTLGFSSLDQYEAGHGALMATEGRLTDKMITDTLTKAGLDVTAADKAYRKDRKKWDGYLARNSKQASALGIRGTPAFIIGNTIYPGAMDRNALLDAVKKARS